MFRLGVWDYGHSKNYDYLETKKKRYEKNEYLKGEYVWIWGDFFLDFPLFNKKDGFSYCRNYTNLQLISGPPWLWLPFGEHSFRCWAGEGWRQVRGSELESHPGHGRQDPLEENRCCCQGKVLRLLSTNSFLWTCTPSYTRLFSSEKKTTGIVYSFAREKLSQPNFFPNHVRWFCR